MAKRSNYDNESISALKGAERVRKRPGVIFGSDDLSGCCHSFFEILSNSIDEAREGFGENIRVTRFPDHSLQVEDEGRGIPLDYNPKEKRFNWELVYCELYAGAKYDNESGDTYEYSLGLNGLGACATQYASSYFEVEVRQDKTEYSLRFEKGENIGGLEKRPIRSLQSGTRQKWLPDREVFTDIHIPASYFRDILQKQAMVNVGIHFHFIDLLEETEEEFYYPEGILGYVKEISAKTALTEAVLFEGEGRGQDRKDKPEYRVKAEVAFCFDNQVNEIAYYHNSSFLAYGGSPDRAVKSAFVSEIDKQLKANNKYKANESKINFNDIEDSLIIIISSFSTMTSYENQTKKAINNRFIQSFLLDLIKTNLEIWFLENNTEGQKVLDQILINKRSRENAEKQRLNIRKKLMSSQDLSSRVKNFVDCRSKDPKKRELYIVEGNSALGSVKMARNSDYQAVIPLRGKILNCLKADYATIFRSEIIVGLLRILGCGVEISTKHNKDLSSFDLKKLPYSKIIICTDADVDGFHIRTLILTMLHRLTPSLIKAGKVFIAESPLFEISHKVKRVEKKYFAYSDREKNELVESLEAGTIQIQRSKGLGENEPEMMWQTTMNPETRRLIELVPNTDAEMAYMFELLYGNNLQGRKDFIAEHGGEYMDMLDVV